jgi:hypothetical protein
MMTLARAHELNLDCFFFGDAETRARFLAGVEAGAGLATGAFGRKLLMVSLCLLAQSFPERV